MTGFPLTTPYRRPPTPFDIYYSIVSETYEYSEVFLRILKGLMKGWLGITTTSSPLY